MNLEFIVPQLLFSLWSPAYSAVRKPQEAGFLVEVLLKKGKCELSGLLSGFTRNSRFSV